MDRLEEIENEIAEKLKNQSLSCVDKKNEITLTSGDVCNAINDVKEKIIQKAADKIQDEKIIEKHSENIAKISDRALEVEAEKQRLVVEEVNANNKVVAQEIKNRLIVLKAEAKRLKQEQKQLDKDQKSDHKRRNNDAKWEIYGDKLKRMKYTYVPNAFVLYMLLFFDGIVGFFNGVGEISTSILKAFKWVLIIGGIIAVLMFVPITREWLLEMLKFKS
jgi:hypothetical protein